QKSQSIMYIGDKENSNTDSALVSTKRSLIYNQLNKELYKKFFLNVEELQAVNDGYIYIHDMSARRDTMNCCLFDVGKVLKGGFEMGNVWYNEPKSLDVAFDVIGDIVLSTAAQQYGGFTVPSIDLILDEYAEKSFQRQYHKYVGLGLTRVKANEQAIEDVRVEFRQGWQGLEYKFNTVGSSRGDYPFITVTLGTGTSRFAKMCTIECLRVHRGGQGKPGRKRPVLFPKIVFLYDKDLHGPGCINEDLFEEGVLCSSKTMYPDWLSLTGEGYVASMYKKYGAIISPMGCRAFLSPWYERGGMEPMDDDDKPVFVGRFNVGAISLHLPMILAKARKESKDFYEVLDYYLELIRKIHCRTYDYLGEMRASTNPLAYCQGGFYGGNLGLHDKIKPILKSATASFGFTALNELQELYNGKSIAQDGEFALEVIKYINKKITEFKYQDNHLYAMYGTPAENLCGLQVTQFRKKYGIIENVSDRPYVSNSFHCHVTEDISPIEKQDLEQRFWDYSNGGKIQYVKYPLDYNIDAIRTLIRRAMDKGFYEGVNLSMAYCEDCGHQELSMDVCPKCGSTNLTKIERMNGYLSYSRVHGDTRLNDAKMAEISERKSM
ncbi:TPA: anaerobic ribonucleoside-triphosphate reductase, partial [Candidatus Avacholeplasma faecigallinarum]|nr:anaerobic ribonucleoside-triphosphate reductase [Candidatus Avacholeplasma faecigallinarum]